MKIYSCFFVLLWFGVSGCVQSYNKPWVEQADALVGRSVRTASEMVVVQRGDHYLLVPVGRETRRFTEPTEHQKVVSTVPVGSQVHMKKRTFRVSKSGRDDYLVVDVFASEAVHRDVLLIVGSSFLTDGNFVGI